GAEIVPPRHGRAPVRTARTDQQPRPPAPGVDGAGSHRTHPEMGPVHGPRSPVGAAHQPQPLGGADRQHDVVHGQLLRLFGHLERMYCAVPTTGPRGRDRPVARSSDVLDAASSWAYQSRYLNWPTPTAWAMRSMVTSAGSDRANSSSAAA